MAKVLKPQLDENLLKIRVYEAEWKCRQLLKNAAILQLRGHKTVRLMTKIGFIFQET